MGRQAKDPRAVQQEARAGPPSGQRIAERFLARWETHPTQPGSSFVTLTQALSSAPSVAQSLREFLTERVLSSHPEGDSQTAARTTALASSQLLGAARTR
jgi:hypothetical protein